MPKGQIWVLFSLFLAPKHHAISIICYILIMLDHSPIVSNQDYITRTWSASVVLLVARENQVCSPNNNSNKATSTEGRGDQCNSIHQICSNSGRRAIKDCTSLVSCQSQWHVQDVVFTWMACIESLPCWAFQMYLSKWYLLVELVRTYRQAK